MKTKLVAITILSIYLIYTGLSYDKNKKITEYLIQQTKLFQKMYETNYYNFKNQSKIIFNTIINQKEVINLYKQVQTANKEQKKNLRKKLYQLLNDDYKKLKFAELKQLHFHLTNNESFLRLHKPDKFGDNLTKTRETIEYVNKNLKSVDGFETGRTNSGYRFVYPLKDENNIHLGSVETSLSISIFSKQFMNNFKVLSNFYIKSSVIDSKVWNNEKLKRYIKSPIKDFYMTKNIVNEINKNINKKKTNLNNEILSKNNIEEVVKNTNLNKSISIYDKNINSVVTFIPIKNPITNKVVAFLTVKSDSNYINGVKFTFNILFLTFSFFTLIIIYFLFTRFETQRKTNKILEEKLEKKVNLQTKIIQNNIDIMSNNILYSKTNLNGIITDVSNAFCSMSQYSKDELIGKSHKIVRHPDMPKSIFKDMWNTIKNNKVWKGEIKNKRKDGSYYWVITSITVEYNEDGEAIGYIAIRYDITDKKELERNELLILEQAKMASMGEMIENIAHQWRQPLNVITMSVGNMELSRELNALTDETFELLASDIKKHAKFLSETIETFRNFIKEEKELKDILLQDRINIIVDIISSSMQDNFIKLEIDMEKEPIHITMVVGELDQVIINILNNAKDILLEKKIEDSWIKLSLYTKDNKIIITIEDNGGGIPEDVISKIFEPYFTTKHKSQGTGLGLHMSYKIITESLKGQIWAENTNNGAKFFIVL
jgi:PAS domain S-box-containing protein